MDLYEEDQPKRFKWWWWAIPVVVVAALGGALYYGRQQHSEPVVEKVEAPPVKPVEEAPPYSPIEPPAAAEDTEPLPSLAQSDAAFKQGLAAAVKGPLDQHLVPKDIIKHFVTTVDNLPRKKTAAQMWPLKPTGGELAVNEGAELTLSEENFARYEPVMALLKSTNSKTLVALYRRYYPLFQQAYTELGYPDGYFNDRLIAVIDHLLETPEVNGPIRLTHPSVHYEFADPALEAKSAGQKLLIRMGPSNAAVLKLKLREFRRQIAKRSE